MYQEIEVSEKKKNPGGGKKCLLIMFAMLMFAIGVHAQGVPPMPGSEKIFGYVGLKNSETGTDFVLGGAIQVRGNIYTLVSFDAVSNGFDLNPEEQWKDGVFNGEFAWFFPISEKLHVAAIAGGNLDFLTTETFTKKQALAYFLTSAGLVAVYDLSVPVFGHLPLAVAVKYKDGFRTSLYESSWNVRAGIVFKMPFLN